MRIRSSAGALALAVVASVVLRSAILADTAKSDPLSVISLPPAQTAGGMSLTEALAQRRSQRAFSSKPLSREQIGQLCWAAQGITRKEGGLRTAPSAMALYPIHVFVVSDEGACEYVPQEHALRPLTLDGALSKLRKAAGQAVVDAAPVSIVLAMEPDRLKAKCGDKSERYSLLEVGHIAQNVLLQATAMGLVSLPAGGIDEGKVGAALDLPKGLRPVYVLPLGYAEPQ